MERDHLEDLDVDRSLILKLTSRNGMEDMDSIALSQDRNVCRGLVNAVMNLRVTLNAGDFLNG